jgi:hypothetical protein
MNSDVEQPIAIRTYRYSNGPLSGTEFPLAPPESRYRQKAFAEAVGL